MDEFDDVFPILGHPMMRPEPGFVELPVDLGFRASIVLLPEHARRKKEKDNKEKK